MILCKKNIIIAVTLFVVLALAVIECEGSGLLKPTAKDYLGTWKCDDPKIPYPIEFTVGEWIRDWGRGSFHRGTMTCGIFPSGTVSITGDEIHHYQGWIQLLLDLYYHSISVGAHEIIKEFPEVQVHLNGELMEPGVIGVNELTISKGEYYYNYRSSDHKDELLLFYKQ